MGEIPRALTIAGSDSGGGAGIEADLKTFTALGVYGMVAITSITAQNTLEVRLTFDLPPEVVVAQIEAVADDIGVDAAKTGMLSNSGIIEAVAKTVKKYGFPLVVDPVMIAKSGAPLLRPEAMEALVKYLVPIAYVITPNRFEAERLTGITIKSVEDAKRAAKYIVEELGAEAAIVKGGHIGGDYSTDILYYKGTYREFTAPRIRNGCYHGTGCAFSAAIAAELAKGKDLIEAVKIAKEFITKAISYGIKVGHGHCPVNPAAWVDIPASKWRVYENLVRAIKIIEEHGKLVNPYIPEVQMNVVEALPKPYCNDINDVMGVLGRIVRYGDKVKAVGPPSFGASRHLARAVLKAMKYNPEVRAALNIKFSEEIIEIAKRLGMRVSYYDRKEEPPEVKAKEGATIPWGIDVAIKRLGGEVPDMIYHRGDVGKEPMINIFGKTSIDAVNKLIKILKELNK